MQANSTLLLYSSLAAAVLATILRFLFIRSFSRPYPPGPAPRPIVGNLFDMPRDYWWLTFAKWSKQYGDIVHLNILGQHIVILNSVKATRDLLDRRSAIYSDRPTLTMINDLMGMGWSFVLMRYGEVWKDHRKMFQQCFNTNAIAKYRDMQADEARKLVLRLFKSPNQLVDHLGLYFVGNVSRIVYGANVEDSKNKFYQAVMFIMKEVAEAVVPGRYLVDCLPLLKYFPAWFPGGGFQRKAKVTRDKIPEFRLSPYQAVKNGILNGGAAPSIVSDYLQDSPEKLTAEMEDILMNVAAVSNSAGIDTTVSILEVFVLAMALHPGVQKKAQDQIDEVVGRDRLPTFSDLDSLPYVHAIYKELLRWQPVAPLGGPHRLMQDDEYNGYYLPKGTLVFGNSWSILHDESVYSDPSSFLPERFLNSDGSLNSDVRDPDIAAFGYGRRKCPGRYYAANGVVITIVTILATSEILSGESSSLSTDVEHSCRALMSGEAMSSPKPFEFKIRPRSDCTADILKESIRN